MDQFTDGAGGVSPEGSIDNGAGDATGATVVPVEAPQDGASQPVLTQSASLVEQVVVSKVSGEVLVISVDGKQGPVLSGQTLGPGDVLMTRGDGALELELVDGTRVFFDSESRVLIEEPASAVGKPQFFVIQGEFSVDSSGVADGPASDVLVRTPVASVTVNGARMIGKAAPEAQANVFVLLPGLGGLAAGSIAVVTSGAPVVIDEPLQGLQVLSLFRDPTLLPEVDAAILTSEFGAGVLAYSDVSDIRDLAQSDEPGLLAQLGEIFGVTEARAEPILLPTEGVLEGDDGEDEVLGGADDDLFSDDEEEIDLGDDNNIVDDGVFRFNGAATVNIADGDATIEGGAGDDTLTIEADPVLSNVLVMNGNADGDALLNFSGGSDAVLTIDEVETVSVNLGTAADQVTIEDLTQTDISDSTVIFDLGAGNDTVVGTNAGKSLSISGGAGNDSIAGSNANDQLDGGADTDVLDFGASNSAVTVDLTAGTATGQGIDTVANIENVIGSGQNDTLTGDGQNNSLSGGLGDDVLLGAAGDDTLDGGTGRDTADFASSAAGVAASLATNTATGDGNDVFVGIEALNGSAQNDTLTGDDNDNALSGGAGDDVLAGGEGDDDLQGGDGVDTADFSSALAAVSADLSAGAASGQGIDTFVDVENLTGGVEADTLLGDNLENVLDGGAGGDQLNGGAGNDTLLGRAGGDEMVGGLGDDVFDGGGGTDRADFSGSADAVDVDLVAGRATGEGNDQLISIENVFGSSGNDTISGSAQDENFVGRGGNDILNGLGGADTLSGAAGEDTINGGDGADSIGGGSDNDIIDGGAGNDTIDGEAGADTLTGGDGNDTFFYDTVLRHEDVIQDFTKNEDNFEIVGANFNNIASDNGTLIDNQSFFAINQAIADAGNLGGNEARFVFDSDNKLHFDPDGDGADNSFEIGTVTVNGGQLAGNDFQVS